MRRSPAAPAPLPATMAAPAITPEELRRLREYLASPSADFVSKEYAAKLLAAYDARGERRAPRATEPLGRVAFAREHGLYLRRRVFPAGVDPAWAFVQAFGYARPAGWRWPDDGTTPLTGWFTEDAEGWTLHRGGRLAVITSHPRELTDTARTVLERIERELGVAVRVHTAPSWVERASFVQIRRPD